MFRFAHNGHVALAYEHDGHRVGTHAVACDAAGGVGGAKAGRGEGTLRTRLNKPISAGGCLGRETNRAERRLWSRGNRPQPNQLLGEVWVNEGARAAASANPSSFMVAGARFELWKRPLTFNFLITY